MQDALEKILEADGKRGDDATKGEGKDTPDNAQGESSTPPSRVGFPNPPACAHLPPSFVAPGTLAGNLTVLLCLAALQGRNSFGRSTRT